jgi:hypothetical protein
MNLKCFVVFVILVVGLSLASAEQQTIADKPTPSQISELVKLSFRLGIAYLLAQQSQDVSGFNSLVDQYNTLVQQNFRENADALLMSKINATNLTGRQVMTENSSPSVMKTPFKEKSDLSQFGKQQVRRDFTREMQNVESPDAEDDWVNWEHR